MNASFFLSFTTFRAKDVNEISAMLKKWALRMKKLLDSYKIKLLSSDNVINKK